MDPIPLPANEARRLKVLWQYEVLDTVPDEVFDDLTELAATICEAPMASISLVDESRQWFKSRVGLNTSETPREISFCTHTILQSDLFIVSDTANDSRFKNNPLVVADPKIRFYAGAPLITPDGHALGSLCILDREPRELTVTQRKALRVLARLVVTELELRRHTKELAKARDDTQSLKRELERTRANLVDVQREKPAQ